MNLSRFLSVTMLVACLMLSTIYSVFAQDIDILLKGGHVIDPKNKIDSKMDVAITNGKIVQVAAEISTNRAKKVVDAGGLYVIPGLIDIHVHVFCGTNMKQ